MTRKLVIAGTLVLAASAAQAADPYKIDAIGLPEADLLSSSLKEVAVAEGRFKLENPDDLFAAYGYGADGPIKPAAKDEQTKDHNVEATKTEPDKNTYLVLADANGAAKKYDYGTHFLFQGHENGPLDANKVKRGLITRINLDADVAHRVTLMADADADGKPLPLFDGSTWDPFAKVLLFTAELGADGGVWMATTDFPSKVTDISGVVGRASYEGVQVDSEGAIWLVEDAGGKAGDRTKNAKQPNSFVFRFVPKHRDNLADGGTLQVLQVVDIYGQPIVFHDGKANDDILAPAQAAMYGYGNELNTKWITVHDSESDGAKPYDANALAKAAGGTPFKRPENGVFRPGTNFTEFYFTATGDTNLKTEAGETYGGFGGVFRLVQKSPTADKGRLAIVLRGDAAHSGFDNLSFLDGNRLIVVEDAGDKLHAQRNAFDAAYLVDVTADYASKDPVRMLAIGRDPMAAIDVSLGGKPGYQNEGDNEITGIHISNGDATVAGLFGADVPTPFENGWRVFYTRQHGENITFEIKANAKTVTN